MYHTKGYVGHNPKYYCGFARYEKFTVTTDENCRPGKTDRGWFYRLHQACKE